MKELPKAFEAKLYEDIISKRWEDSGFFNPDVCVEKGVTPSNAEAFTVTLPPPNVTGTLHMGHASMLAIEDLMVRYHRMKGEKTLWLPGTDHAAVATESKVEGLLIKEEGMKKPKEELGREPFLDRVRQFAQASHDTIVNQCKKMGSSLDWSREAFTLDEPRNLAVRTMFKKMYDDGLIYRGYRVVNWSVKGQSTCSDDELVYVDRPAKLYSFTYGPECPIAISTTRPETKLGDTAIAVHPDGKWKKYIGQTFTIPHFGEQGHVLTLKVIGSTEVDDSFGTGALGVTPAHSMVDFDMYQKEKREGNDIGIIPVIGEDGRMTKESGKTYQGLLIVEARKNVVTWLKDQGLLTNEEDITQSAGTSDRFGDVVEPLPKVQWFINVTKQFQMGPSAIPTIKEGDMVTLKQLMQTAVRQNAIEIIPERFSKTYFYWIDNLRDWCISRQIWYGHQIPVWYKGEDVYCGVEAPAGDGWVQDPDTLDTWFSSGLWTFSTLGWPLTTVHFVRHGEAENNVDNIVSDEHTNDFPLTKRGAAQVKELTETLKQGKKIDAIIASPILRTKQTAEIIAKELGVPLTFDDRLLEVGVGELNGSTEEALEKAREDHGWMVKTPYAIESYTSLHGRTKSFLEEALQKFRGQHIMIVSHGDTLAALKQFGTKEYTPEFGLIQGRATNDTRIFDASNMQSNDFAVYHPTSVLETGYDILPFWVARMILMTTYALGDVPFKTVYLHGLVRDAEGRKMSKSLGNIINPLDMIEKYGTDATRLSLLIGGTPGNDMKLSEEKIAGFRNFTNKIWNIARFMLLNIEEPVVTALRPEPKTETDTWVLQELDAVIERYTDLLERFEYSQAGELLRAFTYDTLADWYLELAKLEGKKDELYNYILNTLLKLWHPFMPFVTETIWHEIYGDSAYLLVERWPQAFEKSDKKKESIIVSVQKAVLALRQLKSDYRIAKAEEGSLVLSGVKEKDISVYLPHIERMAGVSKVTIEKNVPEEMVHAVVQGVGTIALSVKGQMDTAKEKARIQKEIETVAPYIEALKGKLSNEGFVAKAPPAVIEVEKKKLADAEEKLTKLTHQLNSF
jgi:valyl-tRNA synthetase/broad specificity phosphatase PhoE